MATSPVPQWAREMSPYHRGPTAGGVLTLAILAVLVALVLQVAGNGATSSRHREYRQPPPCATVWPTTCPEPRR